jgi:hypothetical protein
MNCLKRLAGLGVEAQTSETAVECSRDRTEARCVGRPDRSGAKEGAAHGLLGQALVARTSAR